MKVGKRQHFELGKYIRRRYTNFLGEKYSSDEVYIRSSDMDRCIMSAQANLAGLYPPRGEQIWEPLLFWQPVPIHTVPMSEDELLYTFDNCERHTQIQREYFELSEVKQITDKYTDFLNFLEKNSGIANFTLFNVPMLRDTLLVEKLKGFM